MPTSDDTSAAVLFVRMEPAWSQVDDLRRFVEHFCGAAGPDPERREQLALAVHELVQNAITHSTSPDIEVKLELDRARGRVTVAVTNSAGEAAIAQLRTRLDRAQAHPNPLEGYVAALREAPDARGGVGLARVRFEAALDLALEVRGEKVTVRAAGPLAAPDVCRLAPERARLVA